MYWCLVNLMLLDSSGSSLLIENAASVWLGIPLTSQCQRINATSVHLSEWGPYVTIRVSSGSPVSVPPASQGTWRANVDGCSANT